MEMNRKAEFTTFEPFERADDRKQQYKQMIQPVQLRNNCLLPIK